MLPGPLAVNASITAFGLLKAVLTQLSLCRGGLNDDEVIGA